MVEDEQDEGPGRGAPAASGGDVRELQQSRSRWMRALWLALGVLSVVLGLVGLLLPGVPTTPFMLLSAACFLRSSPRLYERVLADPTFGPTVRAWREKRTIPAAAKWAALGSMVFFVTLSVGWLIPAEWPWARWGALACGILGALFLLRLPTS